MYATSFSLRWRVKDGKVLLFNRHMRELTHFDLTPALIAWIHERLEWAAVNLLGKDTCAVLVLRINLEAEVQVSLEELRPLPELCMSSLVLQDSMVQGLALDEGVLPATVWLASEDGALTASTQQLIHAVDTLAEQLASTQGISVQVAPQSLQALEEAPAACVLSDEFGLLPLKGRSEVLDKLAANLAQLFS